MAINKQKILKNAAKYTKKGQYDKAIEEYQKISQIEYGESSLNNVIGDLYIQAKNVKNAITEYDKAAQYYEEKGFIPKALAIYRKILRHDPTLARIYEKLAQLYSDQGLIQDAISQYEFLAKHYEHEGKMELALDSYRQIADLDPSNISIRERLASLYQQQGFAEKSAMERVTIGDRYLKRGDSMSAIKNYEIALREMPQNENALRGIVSVHITENRIDEAKQILNQLLELKPDNISAMTTLGKLCMDNNDLDQALSLFQRVAELDPSQEGVNEILGRIYILKGNYPEAFKRLKEIISLAMEHGEYEKALSILQQLQEIEPQNIVIRERMAEIYQKLNRDEELKSTYHDIAEIYYEKGRLEEAYNIYERLFSMDPNDNSIKQRFNQISIEYRGRPIELTKLVEKPKFDKVIQEQSSVEKVIEFESRNLDLDDNAPALDSLFDTSEIDKLSIPFLSTTEGSKPSDLLEDIESDDIFSLEGDSSDLASQKPSAKQVIEPTEDQIREFRIEAGVFLKYGLLEKAAERLKSILVMKPDDDESLEKLTEVYEKIGQMDLVSQTLIKRSDLALRAQNKAHAIELLQQVLRIVPGNEAIVRKLQELGISDRAEASPVSSGTFAAKPAVSGFSDYEPLIPMDLVETVEPAPSKGLSDDIFDVEGVPDQPEEPVPATEAGLSEDLAQVVREFREELISRPHDADVETHLNLGIAYKEMGLLDEAIEEFKLTLDYPEKMVDGSNLLAMCHLEKGEPDKAANILTRALKHEKLSQPELLILKYHLAVAKKETSDFSEALMLLKEIQQIDKNYLDSAKLLKDIKKRLE